MDMLQQTSQTEEEKGPSLSKDFRLIFNENGNQCAYKC